MTKSHTPREAAREIRHKTNAKPRRHIDTCVCPDRATRVCPAPGEVDLASVVCGSLASRHFNKKIKTLNYARVVPDQALLLPWLTAKWPLMTIVPLTLRRNLLMQLCSLLELHRTELLPSFFGLFLEAFTAPPLLAWQLSKLMRPSLANKPRQRTLRSESKSRGGGIASRIR